MDSFYDQPRAAPVPRSIPIYTEKILPTLVPEASMLVQNHGNVPQNNINEKSYNTWKIQHRIQSEQQRFPIKNNTDNINKQQIQPSLCRKQVRFESPKPQQLITTFEKENVHHNIPTNTNMSNRNARVTPTDNTNRIPSLQPNSCDDSFNLSNFQAPYFVPVKSESKNILQSKPFEKIYLANIPNRSLDLSIIEPPTSMQKNQIPVPANYQCNKAPEFLRNNVYDRATTSTQYPMKKVEKCVNDNTNISAMKPIHIAESTTIEPKLSLNDEPTVKDLLKIIQQQNEQLMCLQKQVTTLIQDQHNCHSREIGNYSQKHIEPLNVFKNKQLDHNGLPKFAIDVMTSFEVSIRAPNKFVNRKFNKEHIGHEQKIQEITENDSLLKNNDKVEQNKNVDVSLTLNEPLFVQEECPSPDNSIHVDMQDYSSESEDDEPSSLIGWTIYNNVMDQVNYLLKKPQPGNKEEKQNVCGALGTQTMKKVKEATIKHLKNIGVNLPNVNGEESHSTNSQTSQYSPSEISFAVKQLLMKYLPDEQLAKISDKKKLDVYNKNPTNFITRRPEFSMATLQYMEKYNLLENKSKTGTAAHQSPQINDKLLDITALKQQPKLI